MAGPGQARGADPSRSPDPGRGPGPSRGPDPGRGADPTPGQSHDGRLYVAVVGASRPTAAQAEAAETIGCQLAQAGAIVINGGGSGIMAAASKGAAGAGGTVVGILPGTDRTAANEWISIALPTGLGELRNGLIVRAADVVLAVGGAYGTLSEVALALATGVPVIGYETWTIPGIELAATPDVAVTMALERASAAPSGVDARD